MSGIRRVAVLGCTGSIGTQTLDVISQHADKLSCVALAVNTRIAQMRPFVRQHGVCFVAVGDASLADTPEARALVEEVEAARQAALENPVSFSGNSSSAGALAAPDRDAATGDDADAADLRALFDAFPAVGFGADAVEALATLPCADVVENSLVGAAGLRVSYAALAAEKVLALANKESLVVGGDLIMPMARRLDEASGFQHYLMPIDSEHGAIYQCLIGEQHREVAQLWVTASGGPFRGRTRADLEQVTPAAALAHPTWNMGAKITIDSSTLMNKGLEVIEAHHLFAMPYDRIRVVVQPQSAIHSMVEFTDGSVKAHLGTTDMRIPIQYALSYPERWAAPVEPLDFCKLGSLEFLPPDEETFQCLPLARHAGMVGGTLPCVMNAANEVAVAAFLAEQGTYLGIAACVESVMEAHEAAGVQEVASIEQLSELDAWARDAARTWLAR